VHMVRGLQPTLTDTRLCGYNHTRTPLNVFNRHGLRTTAA
jgi:hypothetical protein